jgi:hypothetical protein
MNNMKNDSILKKCYTVTQRGYVTVLSVLFIAAICVPIVILLFSYAHNFIGISLASEQSAQAKFYAYSCMQKGIYEVQDSGGTAVSGGETYASGQCNFTVSVISGGWQVESIGTSQDTSFRYRAIITSLTPVEFDSIIPVSNF